MQGHVERDDEKILRELFVGQQMPPLPSVGARGVQTHQRNAGAALFEIDAVHLAIDLDMDVAADDRLNVTVHDATTPKYSRGSPNTALTYCIFSLNVFKS